MKKSRLRVESPALLLYNVVDKVKRKTVTVLQLLNQQKILANIPPAGAIPSNRELFHDTIMIAWPSIVESFLVSLVGFIDTMMVSSLGTYAIAAVGLTTQPKLIGLCFFFSINTAVSAIVARRKGEGEQQKANRVLQQAFVIAMAMVVIISGLCLFFADDIMHAAGSQPDTHEYAREYFEIVMGGLVFTVISLVINAGQRGVGNTKIAMRTNLTANGVNIVLNYLLIGGNFGFPALGVAGAAWATVIGSAVGCLMSIASVCHPNSYLYIGYARGFRFDKESLKALANIGSSALAEQIFMRVGFFTYSVIVARMGTVAYAAHQVGMNLMSISFSFGDGIQVAAVSLVGQSLGRKRRDLAKLYGTVCQRFGLFFACCLAVVFVLGGRFIFSWFSSEEAILDYGVMIMQVMSLVIFLQIPQVIFNGCLRGAGDTRYTALTSLFSVTFVRPFFGWLLCFPLNMGLFGAWVGLFLDQACRFVLSYLRFRKGKWTEITV